VLFLDVSVFGVDGELMPAQPFFQLFNQHNGTMPSASAAQSDR
jgi:hypothetical protein